MASIASDGVLDSRFFSTKRISVLLDDNTYLLWRQQVLLAVKAHKLQRFLDSQETPPPPLLVNDNGGSYENPDFALAKIWNAVVALFGSKTTSKLMAYRRALHSQRKGELSMKEFLMKVKGCCDNLASCGEIIGEHEHITAILNGLPPDYESVITIITASQIPYTVQGVTSMLLDTEARQQAVAKSSVGFFRLVFSSSFICLV
ncbi:hypothetical protein Godav_005179 [Gossypium davidsonii]|uniref:Retrotransposon Copia-like N-terminal domain-containing protein n=1 Tax=Gossypium davidsonii TaxID=34287 RepID=A0A7J8T8W6_GOSDV|nr:hypothetical protein [Gossypium davidsonii]